MRAMHDFIVEVEEQYRDKVETPSGLELYVDKRHSAVLSASKRAVVKAVPALSESDIEVGYEVVIDPSILLDQRYSLGGDQKSIHMVKGNNKLFRAEPSLILMYRENEESDWKCHGQNLFVLPIEEKKKKGLIITLDDNKKTYKKGVAKVEFLNQYLTDSYVFKGDVIYIKEERDIEFELDGKTYWWIRNSDIIAAEAQKN